MDRVVVYEVYIIEVIYYMNYIKMLSSSEMVYCK